MHVLAGVVWTFWLGAFLALGAVLTTLAVAGAYFARYVKMKYPPRGATRS